MVNGYIGGNYIDGAHWYLTYLILFEIIVAMIVWIEKKYKVDRMNLLVVWIVMNLVTKLLSQYISPFSLVNNLLGGQYIIFIMLGITLKEIYKNKDKVLDRNKYIFLFIFSQIICLCTQNIITFIGIEIFTSIFVLATREKIKILDGKFMCNIGDISYDTYLLHQNIGYQLILGMISIFNTYLSIYTLMVMLIILVISTLIYKYYDIPIQEKINNIMKVYIKKMENLSEKTN